MTDAHRGIIDVHAVFGPDHGTGAAAGAPLAELVAESRRHGVRLALASSLVAALADPAIGNLAAVEAAADPANGLAPIAVVTARDAAGSTRGIEAAEASGVVGYRLEGWIAAGPAPEAVGQVLRAVAQTGRPLLVPLTGRGPGYGFGEASAIGAATADLGIPVVLLGAHYNHIADDLAAAERYPHLHLETSALAHWRAIEMAVATIGHERILLGTGSPLRPGASAIHAVLLAAIPDDARRGILAGNAVRLFGLPDGPVDLTPPALPVRAWDVHTHLGSFPYGVTPVGDLDLVPQLLGGPEARAVASSALAIFADPATGNDQTVAAAAAASGGPLGYVVVDPHDLAASDDQLRRHLGAPGMVGVKIHGQWSGTSTASRAMADLFARLAPFGRPVKLHNDGDGWVEALEAIARAHPRLPIIVAHAGLGTPSVEAGRLAARTDNVYLELCSSFASLPDVRAAVAAAPLERLLWGSDAPLLDPRFVLGTYVDAGLPASAMDAAFWTNAARLFGGG